MASFNESILSKVLARTIVSSSERSDFLAFGTPVYCPNLNGVKAEKVFIVQPTETGLQDSTAQTPNNVAADLVTVSLTDEFEFTMEIPHDVELKTEFNVLNVVRTFAYQMFKREVSNAIASYIFENADDFTTATAGSSLAQALGSAFHEYVFNGTGSKFSVYKFDNGAPVTSSVGGNEIKLNKEPIVKDQEAPNGEMTEAQIINMFESIYTDINSNEPALYYMAQPTAILNEATHELFYQQLGAGTLKTALTGKFEVAASHETMSDSMIGILGTNNAFAVAFTEPRVQVVPSTTSFSDKVKVYINYGVSLINPEDIVVIPTMTQSTAGRIATRVNINKNIA